MTEKAPHTNQQSIQKTGDVATSPTLIGPILV